MSLKEIFEERKDNPLFNTSYPLKPADWKDYLSSGPLDFSDDREVSFYIHIPFCLHLCKFCEYVRTKVPKVELQSLYVDVLRQDVEGFISRYPSIVLNGFDIGGGTPTALEDNVFRSLLELYADVTEQLPHTADFEPSVEATFPSVSRSKAQIVADAGIHRMSLGIQSSVGRVQRSNGRVNSQVGDMKEKMVMLRDCGIQKINIDFMYGLKNQTVEDAVSDLEVIKELRPEQVTLYELRSNMLSAAVMVSKEHLYNSYCALYNGLIDMGYKGNFGQNTFSKDENDFGVSSYLRHRMLDFSAYKGFGISAQSLSRQGLSYNVGKQKSNIVPLLRQDSFPEEYVYQLPPQEMFAKYVSISAYCGRISISLASKILNDDFSELYRDTIDFCVSEGYVSLDGDTLRITPKGFLYYGAVFSLFSSLVDKSEKS